MTSAPAGASCGRREAAAAAVDERPIWIDCCGERLLGILATPAAGASATDLALVIVVGGPQYRVGSHRQFVLLARALAGAGTPVLRFDTRGMGDSSGGRRNFETISVDVAAAIDALQAAWPAARRIVLMGLCDGASAALLYMLNTRDPRVGGLCLLNPWLRSDASLARTHVRHYYRERFFSRRFVRELVSGRIGLQAVRGFVDALRKGFQPGRRATASGSGRQRHADFRAAMLAGWQGYNGPALLALSDSDLTAREFIDAASATPAWRKVLARGNVSRIDLQGADHTLAQPAARRAFERGVDDWLRSLPAAQPA